VVSAPDELALETVPRDTALPVLSVTQASVPQADSLSVVNPLSVALAVPLGHPDSVLMPRARSLPFPRSEGLVAF
jgi:hypothetical protein